jgi:hypothetical protein
MDSKTGGALSGETRRNTPVGQDIRTQPGEEAQTFLNATALADGRTSLLLDVGSYGNLAGQTWIRQAAEEGRKHGKMPATTKRAKPLTVSGVGEGAQTCTHDCTVPISMETIDGRTVTGTYTSPTVNPSKHDAGGIPGLLGLRALMDRRAIIAFSKGPDEMTITFCGPGDVKVNLSPGSDTFRLYQSPSGHLMIPCCEHQSGPASSKRNREEEIALVSVPTASCGTHSGETVCANMTDE